MISEYPKCICKPKVIWEATESLSITCPPKNAFRTVKANILISVTVKLFLRPSKLDKLFLTDTLPFQIKKK